MTEEGKEYHGCNSSMKSNQPVIIPQALADHWIKEMVLAESSAFHCQALKNSPRETHPWTLENILQTRTLRKNVSLNIAVELIFFFIDDK